MYHNSHLLIKDFPNQGGGWQELIWNLQFLPLIYFMATVWYLSTINYKTIKTDDTALMWNVTNKCYTLFDLTIGLFIYRFRSLKVLKAFYYSALSSVKCDCSITKNLFVSSCRFRHAHAWKGFWILTYIWLLNTK